MNNNKWLIDLNIIFNIIVILSLTTLLFSCASSNHNRRGKLSDAMDKSSDESEDRKVETEPDPDPEYYYEEDDDAYIVQSFSVDSSEGLNAYTYSSFTGIANPIFKIPFKYKLLQNYPNSFNPSTTIKFSLPRFELVSPKIYDLFGQVVATLVSEKFTLENYKYTWDASGFARGVYYYRIAIHSDKIESSNFTKTKKLLLIK